MIKSPLAFTFEKKYCKPNQTEIISGNRPKLTKNIYAENESSTLLLIRKKYSHKNPKRFLQLFVWKKIPKIIFQKDITSKVSNKSLESWFMKPVSPASKNIVSFWELHYKKISKLEIEQIIFPCFKSTKKNFCQENKNLFFGVNFPLV